MKIRAALLSCVDFQAMICGIPIALLMLATECLNAQPTLRTSTPIYVDGAYVVLNGVDLQLDSGAELPGDGSWRFEGSLQQSLTNNAGANASFQNLELENSAGLLLLGDPLYISGHLSFIDGVIDASTNALRVDFGSSATHSGAGIAAHVEGAVRKSGDADFTFPLGENGIYAPARSEATPDGTYEVYYHGNTSPNAGPYYDGNNFPVSTCEYWEFDRISGSVNPQMYFTYENNSCNVVGDFNFLDLVWWNSIEWDPVIGVDPSTSEIGSIAPLNPSWTGQYTLSSFNANLNVLPIALLHFDAQPRDNVEVQLVWTTASEVNNDYFNLERSTDGEYWESFAEVKGAGNSNSILHYSQLDDKPYTGLSYYRLKQTDYDGAYSYSEVKSVMIKNDFSGLLLKPPYRVHDELHMQFAGADGMVHLEVFDMLGKRMIPKVLREGSGGHVQLSLSMARGIYVLRLMSATGEVASSSFFW